MLTWKDKAHRHTWIHALVCSLLWCVHTASCRLRVPFPAQHVVFSCVFLGHNSAVALLNKYLRCVMCWWVIVKGFQHVHLWCALFALQCKHRHTHAGTNTHMHRTHMHFCSAHSGCAHSAHWSNVFLVTFCYSSVFEQMIQPLLTMLWLLAVQGGEKPTPDMFFCGQEHFIKYDQWSRRGCTHYVRYL